MLAAAVDGTRVAIYRCVTRIDLAFRDSQRTEFAGPLVAGLIRQRAATTASRRFLDPPGVRTLTLPPTRPPHAGRWAVSASVEPFIVFRSDVRMAGVTTIDVQ